MKQFNLYTHLKNQRRSRIEQIIYLTLDWCLDKWGYNEDRENAVELYVTYKEDMFSGLSSRADYCLVDNEITIYPSNHSNVRDLVDSVIHEFTHQRQDMSDYNGILNKVGYSDSPLEIEAWDTALQYRKECWYDIKKSVNK